jgi:hypothetical protein
VIEERSDDITGKSKSTSPVLAPDGYNNNVRHKMSWYQHSMNPEAILSLYPSAPPLKKIRVLRMMFTQDGPCLVIEADLDQFPEHVPARWHSSFSVAQAKVSFWAIRDVSIVGWATSNDLEFDLEKKNGVFVFRLHSASTSIGGACKFFRIDGLSGYAEEA